MVESLLVKVLVGKKVPRTPFWFMRQAGRFLPEYRKIRADIKDFLTLCYSPEMAAEVTMQPVRRFDMDAAIVFSDILVIPHAMGMDVRFEKGEGPRMTPVLEQTSIDRLKTDVTAFLEPVAETLRRVRGELSPEKSLIGFCGAPWTVACYMVEGGGSRDFEKVRDFALRNPALFSELITKLVDASVAYLRMQIEAGADVIQIFDSWAGVLSEAEYARWVIAPTHAIITALKERHPHVPVIGFARGSGAKLIEYAKKSGADALGIDTQTPMRWARDMLGKPVQGNLDPLLLAADKEEAVKETSRLLEDMRGKPFIFNLGHGIVPHTPVENVEAIVQAIREFAG